MLERALSMALSLLNRLDDEREEESREVFGCRNCGLIYDPQLYHHSDTVQREDRQWYFCPVCKSDGVELLGALPSTVENEKGVFLVGEEGDCLGPYNNETEAHEALWPWFDRKKTNGTCEKESGQPALGQEGKVIKLVCKGGVYTEGQTKEGEGGQPESDRGGEG